MKRTGPLTPWLFLLPAAAVFLLFVLYPAFEIFLISLQRHSFVGTSTWVGVENYVRLLTDGTFQAALLNSLLYLLVTPVVVTLALGLALLLEPQIRGIRLLRSLSFLPVITPMIVVGIIWKWLLNEDAGLLNALLLGLGLSSAKVPWLSVYPLNILCVMGVTVWKGLGYYAVIFLAGLAAIPHELEEAAALDGAGPLQRFLYLKLPLLKPTIALCVIISSVAALKVFDEVYVIIGGSPAAEQPLVPLIYQTAFLDFRLGEAGAMSVVLFLCTLGFSYLQLRSWRES